MVNLRAMEIDGPSYLQPHLATAFSIFVYADFLSISQFAVVEHTRFAIEYVIDETFDLQGIRKLDKNDCLANWNDVI